MSHLTKSKPGNPSRWQKFRIKVTAAVRKNPGVWRVFSGVFYLQCLIAGLALIFWYNSQQTLPNKPVNLTEEHTRMQKMPALWQQSEQEVAKLLLDLKQDKVAQLGLTQSAILVTTKEQKRYYVSDRFGQISEVLLKEYSKNESSKVPLLVIPGGVPTPLLETIKNLIGILIPLGLLLGMLYMVKFMDRGVFKLADASHVRFDDVIGAQEAKNALTDIMDYLKDPSPFIAVGARPPAGVLMIGPPGTGKTKLAQALAGECGVNFIAVSGSEFTSKYFGAGVQRVKKLFELARKNAPVIIFIDELDGVGARSSGESAVESESNRIINQVLIEIDGFAPGEQVIVVGATNRPENLDPGLLREGRFDRRIHVRLPDVVAREAIFRLYAKNIQVEPDINFSQLARLTTGLSPATLEAIVNQAALIAARTKLEKAGHRHFADAIETIRMGELNPSQTVMTEVEKERVAVHESGHAIIASLLKTGRVEKVSILPRGAALGVTLVTQEEDKALYLRSELNARLQMLLAGRNAEVLIYGEASNGAAHDLEEASKLAMAMVSRFGFGQDGSLFSIGALPSTTQAQSEIAAAVIEAKLLLKSADELCFSLLTKYRTSVEALTRTLLLEETVEGEAVSVLLLANSVELV
ncbi:MAG: AAA family ATPase [Agitococcus sp.]|nr:AAA family ATPase [Agitococcus sp.]